jgi:HSP20 family molecular chaperone IbpA
MTYITEIENRLAPRITSPLDIFVRNLFDTETQFQPLHSVKLKHPVDVYEDSRGLNIEVACTGLTKKDVTLDIEGDILKVFYKNKQKQEMETNDDREYHYSGIAKRSFNFGYKVASKFRLSEVNAKMENGLLLISIPFAPHVVTKPKSIEIK